MIQATTWMNLENIRSEINKPDTEGHIRCDSTSVQYLEQAKSCRQKVDLRLPSRGAREEWELLLNDRVSVWGGEKWK